MDAQVGRVEFVNVGQVKKSEATIEENMGSDNMRRYGC